MTVLCCDCAVTVPPTLMLLPSAAATLVGGLPTPHTLAIFQLKSAAHGVVSVPLCATLTSGFQGTKLRRTPGVSRNFADLGPILDPPDSGCVMDASTSSFRRVRCSTWSCSAWARTATPRPSSQATSYSRACTPSHTHIPSPVAPSLCPSLSLPPSLSCSRP